MRRFSSSSAAWVIALVVLLALLGPLIGGRTTSKVSSAEASLSGTPITTVDLASGESIPSGVSRAVPWDTQRQDVAGWWSPSAPTQVRVSESGVYLVTWQIAWATAADTNVAHTYSQHLQLNGTTSGTFRGDGRTLAAEEVKLKKWDASKSISWVGRLAAGDKLSCWVFQNTGSTIKFGGWNRPARESANDELSVVRLGP